MRANRLFGSGEHGSAGRENLLENENREPGYEQSPYGNEMGWDPENSK